MTIAAEIERWLRETDTLASRLGRAVSNDPGLVGAIRNGRSVGAMLKTKIRAVMAANPNGIASPRQPKVTRAAPKGTRTAAIRDEVAAEARGEAERREQARVMGIGSSFIAKSDPVAQVLIAAGPKTPSDAIARVVAGWPETWSRIVAAARAQRQAPGALMIDLIERGLEDLG